MARSALAVAVLLCVQPVASLLINGARAVHAPSAAVGRRAPTLRMLTEDEEFEEFKRKKLGAVKRLGSDENFGEYRKVENNIYKVGGAITILVPLIAGIWAYSEGYLTPQ